MTLSVSGYTYAEQQELEHAVRRNCACELQDGAVTKKCGACMMLDTLNGTDDGPASKLLFYRRISETLREAEARA